MTASSEPSGERRTEAKPGDYVLYNDEAHVVTRVITAPVYHLVPVDIDTEDYSDPTVILSEDSGDWRENVKPVPTIQRKGA